jgi:hypothetical protein
MLQSLPHNLQKTVNSFSTCVIVVLCHLMYEVCIARKLLMVVLVKLRSPLEATNDKNVLTV